MLVIMNDLPESALGVSGEGKITGTDYETVFIPALEKKIETNKKIQLLYHLGTGFTGFDLSAMYDDAKVGFKYLHAFTKIALVSDRPIINNLAKFFGDILSCDLRIFKDSELNAAKEWIAEKQG